MAQITPRQACIHSEYVETHQHQARYAPRVPITYGGHEVMRIVFDLRDLFDGRYVGYVVTTTNRVMRFGADSRFDVKGAA